MTSLTWVGVGVDAAAAVALPPGAACRILNKQVSFLRNFAVAVIEAVDTVGEMAVVTGKPWSTSLHGLENAYPRRIPSQAFDAAVTHARPTDRRDGGGGPDAAPPGDGDLDEQPARCSAPGVRARRRRGGSLHANGLPGRTSREEPRGRRP
jgi:hypothetical protein